MGASCKMRWLGCYSKRSARDLAASVLVGACFSLFWASGLDGAGAVIRHHDGLPMTISGDKK